RRDSWNWERIDCLQTTWLDSQNDERDRLPGVDVHARDALSGVPLRSGRAESGDGKVDGYGTGETHRATHREARDRRHQTRGIPGHGVRHARPDDVLGRAHDRKRRIGPELCECGVDEI